MAPTILKSLAKLPRESLVDLCLKWTNSPHSVPYLTSNRNVLESDEEDYLHEPAENVTQLKKIYEKARAQEDDHDGLSRKDIVDRIVDGDWRRGLSLQQLADIDFAKLEQSDTALRWSALELVHMEETSHTERTGQHPAKKRKTSHPKPERPHYPTIAPANFVANLKSHINPLVKAHYSLHRLQTASKLAVIRLYIVPNTPFAPLSSNVPRNVRQATDAGRVMYIAMPDSCPYIYVSVGGTTALPTGKGMSSDDQSSKAKVDITATKRIVLEAIPKALSKPQERWSLRNSKLTCRSLKALNLLRGNGRPGTAGGCYSKFSEEYEWTLENRPSRPELMQGIAAKRRGDSTGAEVNPLTAIQSQPPSYSREPQSPTRSQHLAAVSRRFGSMNSTVHAKIDRFHLTLNNVLAAPVSISKTAEAPTSLQPSRKSKRKRRSLEDIEAGRATPVEPDVNVQPEPASITLTFSGTDVFRGMKELALHEGGRYVDLDRLPSWATGEKGVSGLIV